MFANSPGDDTPRMRQAIDVKKTMFPLCFIKRKLLVAEDVPTGQKYNQDYFISAIIPELEREKLRYKRKKQGETLSVHMDHSKSHDGGKIQGKVDMKDLVCFPHPLYSHDLSACDFCFFGMATGEMKDREF
jgi:hypothetical protein